MRLFCGGIRGEHRFLVVDRADDLPWRDDADPATRAEAARLIRPLGLATDAAGYPLPHGTVLYGDTLFTCNFQLDADGTVRFDGGDLLGIVVADYLDADAVAVPISTNDAVDIHFDRCVFAKL